MAPVLGSADDASSGVGANCKVPHVRSDRLRRGRGDDPPKDLPDHPAPLFESGDRRQWGIGPLEPVSHNRGTTLAPKNGTGGPFGRRGRDVTLPRLIHSWARGGERNGETASNRPARACRGRCCAPSLLSPPDRALPSCSPLVRRSAPARSGIVPPSNPSVNVPPQVMPHCTVVPGRRHQRRLHRLGAAQHQLRALARRTWAPSSCRATTPVSRLPCSSSSSPTRNGATAASLQFSGLDHLSRHRGGHRCGGQHRPLAAGGVSVHAGGSIFALDYTPLGADFAWMYNDGYGGTNLDCTTPLTHDVLGPPGQHPGHLDDRPGARPRMMGDADTSGGQYTQIFANQNDPADSARRPDHAEHAAHARRAPTAPDVVQVLPASSSSARRPARR